STATMLARSVAVTTITATTKRSLTGPATSIAVKMIVVISVVAKKTTMIAKRSDIGSATNATAKMITVTSVAVTMMAVTTNISVDALAMRPSVPRHVISTAIMNARSIRIILMMNPSHVLAMSISSTTIIYPLQAKTPATVDQAPMSVSMHDSLR